MAKRPYHVPPVTPSRTLARPAPARRAIRTLSETDRSEWARYTIAVTPLPGKTPLPAEEPVPLPAAPPPDEMAAAIADAHGLVSRQAQGFSVPAIVPLTVGIHPPGIDTGTWNRFRNGRLGATRVLDLHGHTLQRAYHAFESLLLRAHADGHRCVEVITGRGRTGSGESIGAIRRELPLWINLPHLRPLVLGMTHPHAANTGSVRILLRRPK